MNDEIEKFSTSFLKIPNSFSEMTITSIQSFESSLFMIMLDRWPAALVHLSTAIETILKAHLSHRDNQHILSSINKEGYVSEYTYFQLIELMCLKEELSTFIKSSSHEVRINRNKFIHGKLIPKDTPDAIEQYFTKALLVYNEYFKILENVEIYDLIENNFLKINIIYTKDRIKIFTKEYENKIQEISAEDFESNLSFSVDLIIRSLCNIIYPNIVPSWMNDIEILHDNVLDEAKLENEDTFSGLQYDYPEDIGQYIGGLEIECHAGICSGELMFELFTKEDYEHNAGKYGPLSSATCNLCRQIFFYDYIEKYIISKLPKEKVNKFIEKIVKI